MMKVGPYKPLRPETVPDPSEPKTGRDPRLQKAAEMYEKQFLREMVKAMRSTVAESDLIEHSQGERIFREQLDEQYVENWGDSGGIGLADVIYKQIEERFGSSVKLPPKKNFKLGFMPLTPQKNKPQISQTENSLQIKMKVESSTQPKPPIEGVIVDSPNFSPNGTNQSTAQTAFNEQTSNRSNVRVPLNGGVLLAQGQYDELTRWARISHGDNLVSDIRFQGEANPALRSGQSLTPDTSLGTARLGTEVIWSLTR